MPLHGKHLHLMHRVGKTQWDAQNINVIQWVIKINGTIETKMQTRR